MMTNEQADLYLESRYSMLTATSRAFLKSYKDIDAHEKQDCLQSVLLESLEIIRARDINNPLMDDAFDAYLRVSAENHLKHLVRKRYKELGRAMVYEDATCYRYDPGGIGPQNVKIEDIETEYGPLQPRLRRGLQFCLDAHNGYSYSEIAQRHDTTEYYVTTQISWSRQQMKQLLTACNAAESPQISRKVV